ncbi:MAG: hypothetical protein ACI9E5_000055 [Candidatus Omnitrophota bacterium]|jgi:hypothetical protein
MFEVSFFIFLLVCVFDLRYNRLTFEFNSYVNIMFQDIRWRNMVIKRCVYLILVISFMSGCVAVNVSTQKSTAQIFREEPKAIAKIDYVFIGMTKDEVKGVLGEKLRIGYLRSQGDDKVLKAITLDSPYKSESFKGSTGSYDVLYYYTHVKRADNIIAEDEMTPLVFEEGKLIGKGWDFLFRLKENK